MTLARSAALDDPVAMRHAGRGLLALAMMDTRNALLALVPDDADGALRRQLLAAGAWPEWWISRHLQREQGEAAADAPRLPSLEPRLDAWLAGHDQPSLDELRSYLAATLELTLDLLATAPETDAGLLRYRQALHHEDRLVETLRETLRDAAPPPRPERPPLLVAARRWTLGGTGHEGGFVPEAERGREDVAVPAFEIDAQPVNWAHYAEFADNGGYDRDELWSAAGRHWRDRSGRRAPAFVEQLAGGVVLLRGHGRRARLEKAPRQQAAAHVTRHEAEAWCRWAGRRLPTEPEWALAAATQPRLGFAWGDVHEWVAGRARWLDGTAAPPAPTAALDLPQPGLGLLCGGSWATPPRWRHAGARRFAAPDDDTRCSGFRSCAS